MPQFNAQLGRAVVEAGLLQNPQEAQRAIAGRLTHRGATGCRPRLGAGRAARPGHHGGRGAAPLCVWSSTALRQFLRDRRRGTQVSNNEMSMMPSTGTWPPRARTHSTIACPPPAAHEPRPTWQGKPRRLAASSFLACARRGRSRPCKRSCAAPCGRIRVIRGGILSYPASCARGCACLGAFVAWCGARSPRPRKRMESARGALLKLSRVPLLARRLE